MKTCILAVTLALLLAAGQALAFSARVKSVHDGDSFSVHGPDDALLHIRMYGIDAPETRQPFGYQAKKRLSKLVSRTTVDIESLDIDRYGRTVALVRLADGTLVNQVMVADGLAWVYDEYCKKPFCTEFNELQEAARREKRGLWAENTPQRPADWRRENKAEEWYKAPVRAVKRIARHIKVVLHK